MLQSIGLIFIIGFIMQEVFQKVKIPSLVGFLWSGILLGPFGFNILDESLLNISGDLREVALLIILTQAGLSLELSDFKKMGHKAIFMSFVPACFEIFATFMVSQYLFGLSPVDALLLGAIIASASPAVIVPRMLKLMKEGYGIKKGIPQLILTGDSVDDVFNIVVFSSVLGLQGGGKLTFSQFLLIPVSILIGVAIGVGLGLIVSKLFERIKHRFEFKTLLLLSVGFLLMGVESYVESFFPFSALICVIAMGVTLLNMQPKDAVSVSNQLSKLWIGAQVLLFALVGASVNINYITFAGISAILMMIVVLCIRGVGILLSLSGSDFTLKEKLFCVLSGIPKATVQAAIGGIPLAMGIASGELILAISVIAILFTAPIGAMLLDTLYPKLLTDDRNTDRIIS
ncbi:potassium transporter [Erysipelothrix larvae]|uniref:Potassium transporter n=1 Tax=Erysipelothrix larvae TaxID=1514105 RepID=A0A0X8GYM6_9FIRM|nr:cation:proton antiporter [Erysipelothrix larvae]AMC92825.1 potassium transporter [Erysipelothrix larvae]